MMDMSALNGPVAAFMAGLVTSLHCVGMCGPLACMLTPAKPQPGEATLVHAGYHGMRLLSYTLLGLLFGAVGGVPARWLQGSFLTWMPWLLVVFFLLVALRVEHRLPRIPALAGLIFRVQQKFRGRPRVQAAAATGFFTPLLPCGPLYFLILLAAVTGSAARGAELMLAFGLGTVPLLWLVQANFGWWRERFGPVRLRQFQSALALVAAGVIAWRLRGTLGFAGPGVEDFLCW